MKLIFIIYFALIVLSFEAQNPQKPSIKIAFGKIEYIAKNGVTSLLYKTSKKKLNGEYDIFVESTVSTDTPILLKSKYIVNKGYIKNSFKNGVWATNYNNKLVKTAHWNNGLITGLYTVKTTKGVLLYNTNFGPKGNGKFKDYYYKTGVLKQEGDYQNGKKEGEWCNYNTQGELTTTVHYKQGVVVK